MSSRSSTTHSSDKPEQRNVLSARWRRVCVVGLLAIHSALLGYSASRNSWTWDEVSFLPAGISHWKFGDFELFDVNPPLVRMVAAVPVLFADPALDWDYYTTNPTVRPERPIGKRFLEINGERSFWLLTIARWACIPFSLLGGYVCYRWARELYGSESGLLALFLWTFAPTIIAHGQLMTADVGGASLGVLGFYVFWKWLQRPTWRRTILLGLTMGLLECAKATWVILFGVWPAIWLLWRCFANTDRRPAWFRNECCQLASVLVIAIYVLNLCYGFQGTGKLLGEYQFISTAVGGPLPPGDEGKGQIPNYPGYFQGSIRNRFSGTWMANIPVPLPQKYVEGIDRQKSHFEWKNQSYLRGEWKEGGWYHYYVYALFVKTPHGLWLIFGASFLGSMLLRPGNWRLRDGVLITGMMFFLIAFVSLQTGINRHLRYVLPAFPFAFILAGRAAAFAKQHRGFAAVTATGCIWLIFATVSTYPHHLTYFNELSGGPKQGGYHLESSNVDWGQDLLFLREWLQEHPDVELDGLAWHCRAVDPAVAGIIANPVPRVPEPGWYAVSQNWMHKPSRSYAYFRDLEPEGWAGYSTAIYFLDEATVDRLQVAADVNRDHISLVSTTESENYVSALSWNSRSQQLVRGFQSGRIEVTCAEQSKSKELSLEKHRSLRCIRQSETGRIAAGWANGRVAIFDKSGKRISSFNSDVGELRSVDISRDGSLIAVGGEDGTVEIRSMESIEKTIRVAHEHAVWSVAFSADGTQLLTGSGGNKSSLHGALHLWKTSNGQPVATFPKSTATVKGLSCSSDGNLVAARGENDSLQVWETETHSHLVELQDSKQVMTTCFTECGQYVIGGDYNGRLKIWSIETGNVVVNRQIHEGMISAVCVINDGRVMTAGKDRTTQEWDLSAAIGNSSAMSPDPRLLTRN